MLQVERYLPDELSGAIAQVRDEVTEIRLRAARPAAVSRMGKRGTELVGREMPEEMLRKILSRMMEHSIYAWEDELRQGYFTLPDGSRVGVAGRCIVEGGQVRAMGEIGSAAIRIARERRGAGLPLFQIVRDDPGASVIVLSPPGMGKTTMLRDGARLLSEAGWNVAVADERSEIAASRRGVPSLDLGPRADVLDGCPKEIAIPMLIRSMSPDVIVTDEIGRAADADAVRDATRCGCSVLASAHANSLEDAFSRQVTGELMRDGAFSYAIVLSAIGDGGRVFRLRRPREAGCA